MDGRTNESPTLTPQRLAVSVKFFLDMALARYVAKYVVSPPISVRRIDRYDGQRVTYHYHSHRTERVEHETVAVGTFIGRMVQHTVPKGFKRIRYYGVQATKTFAKVKVAIQAALAKVEGIGGRPRPARGVAPLRHHTASRDTPVAAHGRRNDLIASHAS